MCFRRGIITGILSELLIYFFFQYENQMNEILFSIEMRDVDMYLVVIKKTNDER